MFLLAYDLRHSLVTVIGEGFSGVFQESGFLRRFGRGHRGREINQPFGIGRKPAHDLQRGYGILLADRDVVVQAGRNDPLAQDILHVEQIVVLLLGTQRRSRC